MEVLSKAQELRRNFFYLRPVWTALRKPRPLLEEEGLIDTEIMNAWFLQDLVEKYGVKRAPNFDQPIKESKVEKKTFTNASILKIYHEMQYILYEEE